MVHVSALFHARPSQKCAYTSISTWAFEKGRILSKKDWKKNAGAYHPDGSVAHDRQHGTTVKGSSTKLKGATQTGTILIHQPGLMRYSVHRVGHIESIHRAVCELRICWIGEVIGHVRVDSFGDSGFAHVRHIRGKGSLSQAVWFLICLSGIKR